MNGRCLRRCLRGMGLVTVVVGLVFMAKLTDWDQSISLRTFNKVGSNRDGASPTCAEKVQTACLTLGESAPAPPNPRRFRHLLVFDKIETIFCYVPKAGSTSFKAMLMYASDHRNVSSQLSAKRKSWTFARKLHATIRSNYKSLDSYTPKGRKQRLNTYFKFMVVRHPLERLASTYDDKFHKQRSSTWTFNKFNPLIHKAMNHSGSPKQPVSFKDFVQYLPKTRPAQYDEHWTRYHDICFPCNINYTYIAKLETLSADVPVILQHVREASNLTELNLPSYNANDDGATEELYRTYYRELDEAALAQLYSIYELDFKLFDYDRNLWHS